MRLNKILLKRAVAAFAAACTLGTCCVAGSVAWAEPEQGASTANIDSKCGKGKNGSTDCTSITIHKYEAPELKNVAHDGRELDSKVLVDTVGSSSVAKKAVKGVEFTIWRLKTYQTGPAAAGSNTKTDEVIDLSKADGWSKINKVQYLKLPKEATPAAKPAAGKSTEPTYTVDQLMKGDTTAKLTQQFNKYTGNATKDNTAGYCTVANTQTKDGAKCVTGEDGSVSLKSLPMGLYYIEETDISKAQINTAAAGETAVWKKVSITKAVAPFFITTPLSNSDPDSQKTTPWLYDVHVYPKNDTNPELPTKTGDVNRNDLVGDTTVPKKSDSSQTKKVEGTHITWTIAIPLTAPNGKDKNNNVVYKKIGFVDKLIDKLTLLKDAQNKPMVKAKIAIYKEETDKAGVKKFVPSTVESSGKQVPEEVPLDSTNDYDLTEPVATGTGANSNTLTFTLKDNVKDHGLKLAKAKYDEVSASKDVKKLAKLVVEIVTKVDDTSLNEIANVANTFVDDNKTGDGDGDKPCAPGDETDPNKPQCHDKDIPNEIMHFGTLTVSKFFKAGEGQQDKNKKKNMPLNGAKFDIYEVSSKVGDKNQPVNVDTNDITKATKFDAVNLTQPVTTIVRTADTKNNISAATFNVKKITHKEPADEATKAATDEATTMETHHNDSATKDEDKNGKDSVKLLVYKAPKGKAESTSKLYCLVETKAPAGYKLDSAPHCVQLQEDITAGGTVTEQNVKDRVAANLVEVENFKATELDKILGSLPMTGARGLVILTLCGIVGIAGTFFYIVLKRRKEQEQE